MSNEKPHFGYAMIVHRLAVVCFAVLLAACSGAPRLSPYRIDVRQGNLVTQDMAAQLKPGMSKDQVRFVLGTPLITDVFHADRWDYVYRFQPGRGEPQHRQLTVFFEQGKLVRVAGDVVAESGEAERAVRQGSRLIDIGQESSPAAQGAKPQ